MTSDTSESASGPMEPDHRALAEHAADVLAYFGPDDVFTWVSPSIEAVLGWKPDDWVGQRVDDFVHPDDLQMVLNARSRIPIGRPEALEFRIRAKDGTYHWLDLHVRPYLDEDGEQDGVEVSFRVVDDQVAIRQELAESERRYRMVVDHMSDLIGVMDLEKRVEWIAPTVTSILGWTAEELVGTVFTDLVHPDDMALMDATDAHLATGDVTGSSATDDMTLRIRRKDGSYTWTSGSVRVMVDDEGRPTGLLGLLRDVDELVRAREDAQRDRARLQATLDTLIDPHASAAPVRDESGAIVDFVFLGANDAACAYNRMTRDELVGSRLLDVLPGHAESGLFQRYVSVIETGSPLVLDDFPYAHERQDGEPRHFDLRVVKVGDTISNTWRDVTDRHTHQQELAELATHDPLTGLANRAALLEELARALSAASRSGHTIGVLMIDLDHFKIVNDTVGHPVGDALLRNAAGRIAASVRAGDLVARHGGDEFVVVMRDLDGPDEAVRAASRLVEEFQRPIDAAGNEFRTTASIGIAISTAGSGGHDLLREADIALYRAKDEGRNRYSLFNEELRREVTERLTLEHQLRPALERGELTLWYQPEVELGTGTMTAVEALLRWHHPSGEVYTADRFIEVAEDTGLILDIGDWVLRRACEQAAEWARLDPARPLVVRVNLSALQLGEGGLLSALDEALASSGVDPSMLCVEMTESALLHETAAVNEQLAAIRRRAVRLAIDDFGSGYAALAYLSDCPVDVIKIDRSLIAGIATSEASRRLVSGIVALAGQLGIAVTAEGIEHGDQADLLRSMGCTAVQGYLYSPAVPPEQIPAMRDRVFPHH